MFYIVFNFFFYSQTGSYWHHLQIKHCVINRVENLISITLLCDVVCNLKENRKGREANTRWNLFFITRYEARRWQCCTSFSAWISPMLAGILLWHSFFFLYSEINVLGFYNFLNSPKTLFQSAFEKTFCCYLWSNVKCNKSKNISIFVNFYTFCNLCMF